MASRDTFSRDVEFGQLMVRVNELLDAEDGDDEKSLNFDAVALHQITIMIYFKNTIN